MGPGGGRLILKLLGPLVGTLLAAVGACTGAGLGEVMGFGVAPTLALVGTGALVGGLVGLLVAAVLPPPSSVAQQALESLRRGSPLPDHPDLQPLRLLQQQVDDATVKEAALGEQAATARRQAAKAEGATHRLRQQVSEAEKVRSAFLTRMSHELRTPLNAVIGYAEMLGDVVDDEEALGDLTKIRRAGLHLKGLVTTILDLTQLESGRYEVRPVPVDLVAMVQEVVEGARNEAELQQDQIELDLPTHAMATVDPRMMQSILFNLVHNAVKYTARGTVSVRLVVDTAVHLQVSDTGIGMTPQQLAQAFEPFAQGDDSTTRRYDGSGLGLAICKGFAEAMQGRIDVVSEVGEGATIDVRLPLVVEAHVPDDDDVDEPTMLMR